jgi:aspartate/methionine/tyrosine aminotransferase
VGQAGRRRQPKTRLIIINTPHNPTSTVLRPADMQRWPTSCAAPVSDPVG